jgi:galactitol-specific phosphotransferase system IIC component
MARNHMNLLAVRGTVSRILQGAVVSIMLRLFIGTSPEPARTELANAVTCGQFQPQKLSTREAVPVPASRTQHLPCHIPFKRGSSALDDLR